MATNFSQNSLQLAPSGQAQRQQKIGQMLASQGLDSSPAQGGWVEALSRVGQAYFGNQMMQEAQADQDKRRQAMADTLQRATQAGQAQQTIQNPDGTTSSAQPGIVGPSQMNDAQRMASVLSQNPDTAPVGLQLSMEQALKEPQAQTRTISGSQANKLFGTKLAPGSAVTLEAGPRGTSIKSVQQPQEQEQPDRIGKSDLVKVQTPNGPQWVRASDAVGQSPYEERKQTDFSATNVVLPQRDKQGQRLVVRGRETDQGQIQILNDEGKWVDAPPKSYMTGMNVSGTREEVIPSSVKEKLNTMEANTKKFIATAGDAITMLDKNPDINTFTARAASLVNNLQQEAKALARQTGVEFDASRLDPNNYESTFDELGVKSPQLRSMVVSLAFQRALANNPSGRISEPDFRNALKEIGADASDPRALKATLRDVADRTARGFRINYETRLDSPYEGDLGLDRLQTQQSGGPSDQRQPGPTRERAQQQGGEIELDPETQRLLEKYQ